MQRRVFPSPFFLSETPCSPTDTGMKDVTALGHCSCCKSTVPLTGSCAGVASLAVDWRICSLTASSIEQYGLA